MTLSEAVAHRTKQLLAERNMSQYQLERLSTIHHSTMIDLMKGQYKSVNLRTVMLIVRAFGITAQQFFASAVFDSDEITID